MCSKSIAKIVSPIVSIITGARDAKKADKRAREANEIAERNAANALKAQQDDNARANKKQPNVSAILATNKNKQTNQTALSGAGGVSSNSLQLGKNTLLGQ